MRARLILLAGLLCLIPGAARAADGEAQTTEYLTAKMIGGAVMEGVTYAAIDLQLKPEWHSYWRMPGEGGLPPKFDWAGSHNLKAATVHWPIPHRFAQQGMYSFGYGGETILPVAVTAAQSGQPVDLALKIEMMVCKDICIPQHLVLSLTLPAKQAANDARIEAALKTLPHDGDLPAFKITSAVIGPKALVVRAFSQNGWQDADLFAEVKDGAFYFTTPPVITPDAKDPRNATLLLNPPDDTGNMAAALMHHKVTLTLVKDKTAIEKTIDF